MIVIKAFHGREISHASSITVKDPVCGMYFTNPEYQEQDYYFCWIGCKEKFDANPERYVGKTHHDRRG